MQRQPVLATVLLIALCGLVAAAQSTPQQPGQPPAAQTPGPPPPGRGGGRGGPAVVSPQVETDRRVTFRILAPNATAVTVGGDITGSLDPDPSAPAPQPAPAGTQGGRGGGAPVVTLTKGESGIWSGTTVRPVRPGAWRYTFNVDGVTVVDSRNVNESPGGHTWDNWRLYLYEVAPRLFR
jgi:hypothetical protein